MRADTIGGLLWPRGTLFEAGEMMALKIGGDELGVLLSSSLGKNIQYK